MRACEHRSRLAELDLQDYMCRRFAILELNFGKYVIALSCLGYFTFLCGFAVFVTPYAPPSHSKLPWGSRGYGSGGGKSAPGGACSQAKIKLIQLI